MNGVIDMISTDHAPHARAEKLCPSIWEVAPGFPGVETSMRLMLTEVSKGRMSLPDYVRMACEAPARAFGLYPARVFSSRRGCRYRADRHEPDGHD